MKQSAYKSYQRVRVTTNDPTKIVVMLYEGAIRNLFQAIEHFEAERNLDASERIKPTLDIIHYLTTTLDHEQGGEVALNLETAGKKGELGPTPELWIEELESQFELVRAQMLSA